MIITNIVLPRLRARQPAHAFLSPTIKNQTALARSTSDFSPSFFSSFPASPLCEATRTHTLKQTEPPLQSLFGVRAREYVRSKFLNNSDILKKIKTNRFI